MEQFDINNCIPLYTTSAKAVEITNKAQLDSLIRNDRRHDYCVEQLKDFDLARYSLLGINLNTGWCGTPGGLNINVIKLEKERKYAFYIKYDEPMVPCRAFSSYDLWVKVPALPEGFTVDFIVSTNEITE